MWWKIYFWFTTIIYIPSVLLLLLDWSKFSFGDLFILFLGILSLIGLYSYAYGKYVVQKKYWRIFFIVLIIDSVLSVLYYYTSFDLLSSIFEAKYLQYLDAQYANGSFYKTASDIFCTVFSLPFWYIMYALSFRELKKRKQEHKLLKASSTAQRSKVAIASFVTGILGFILGPGFTIAAFVTGIIGIKKIEKSKGKMKGIRLAWSGIIMSIIQAALALFVVSIILLLASLPGLFNGYQSAVNHMNKEQLSYYQSKLIKIKKTSSLKEVNSFLGKPFDVFKTGEQTSYSYKCPEKLANSCTVNVYITNNHVDAVGWVVINGFWFYRDFTIEK